MKAKATIAFTIKDRNGYLHPSVASFMKKHAINNWCKDSFTSWKQWYKDGYRCVKVQITEVKPK